MEDVREQEVKDRSKSIEDATLPEPPLDHYDHVYQRQVNELKTQVNDSMEAIADRLLQIEGEIETFKASERNGVLSEQELLKVVGFILSNEKLVAFLVDKLKDKLNADRPIYNISIGG